MEIRAILAESLNCMARARRLYPPKSDVEESALRWELYAAFQNLLDALAMIVSDLGMRKPSSYSGLGDVLLEAGVIDSGDRDLIARIARVRNILAHAYRRVSLEDIGQVISTLSPAVERLVHKLVDICEKRGVDPLTDVGLPVEKLRHVFEDHGVVLAYLFGSRAKGLAREDSDYDFAVLFEKPDAGILEEVELGIKIARELGIPPEKVDVVSLNRADTLLKARVFREGIAIYARDEEYRRRWERRTYIEILSEMDLYATYVNRRLKPRSRTCLQHL